MTWTNIFRLLYIFHILNVQAISLNGKWEGYIPSTETKFIANVPGGIFSDLKNSKLIGDNLKGFNDIKHRWIANESVIYFTQFEASNSLLNSSNVILRFHGLDTFATVYMNNVQVGESSNMFQRYDFDVKEKLKIGTNELKLVFKSSVKMAEDLFKTQSVHYVVPPKCVPKQYHGECHVNHIRKMQASFGWDWGPAFPSMGIWRKVELLPVNHVFVTEITADILKEENSWRIIVTAYLKTFNNADSSKSIAVGCDLKDLGISNASIFNISKSNDDTFATVTLTVPMNAVQMWWPNVYGQQALYQLNVTIKYEHEVLATKEMKIGFRTIELVQEPLKKGLSFYFKVNGVPIFAKGSNWIPSSVFPENLQEEETYKNLLKASKDTHMNMLRVWGGGVYESNRFYELADEYGIMIWQDFMFACSMYPSTSVFLNAVKTEVNQNMKRLKHHPSIVLWAGNNENEAALYGNWYGTGKVEIYREDYIKLYADTIKQQALKVDSLRPFVISSPSNGIYTENNNFTASNPYLTIYGDVHYYNYLKNGWDSDQYPVTRFASEYGFQSLPSIWTLLTAVEKNDDLFLNSTFLDHRQHLPGGYGFLKLLINKNFDIPNFNDSVVDLVDFIYLSQVNQAVSVKIETERYRQMKSLTNDLGEGMTMGALYWQLNDVWQAPTWSSIDFQGRWKMLHYFAKDFFSPVIITSHVTQGKELELYVVSDLLTTLYNSKVEIIVYEWSTVKPINVTEITNITIEANESKMVANFWMDMFLMDSGCGNLELAKHNCFIELSLKNDNDEKIAPLNYVYPSPLKQVSLPNDSVEVKIGSEIFQSNSPNEIGFQVEITTQSLAMFVWLEVGNLVGRFSENGFHILQAQKKVIMFNTTKTTTVKDIAENLIVTSLARIYDHKRREADVQIVVDTVDTIFHA